MELLGQLLFVTVLVVTAAIRRVFGDGAARPLMAMMEERAAKCVPSAFILTRVLSFSASFLCLLAPSQAFVILPPLLCCQFLPPSLRMRTKA